MDFIVATGIECSAPIIRGGIRRDQLLLTEHWRQVRGGLRPHRRPRDHTPPVRCARSTSSRATRPPLTGPGQTSRLAALRSRGIEPIADLLHFAVPDRLTGIGDPGCPPPSWHMSRRSRTAIHGSAGIRRSTSRSSRRCSRQRTAGGTNSGEVIGHSSERSTTSPRCGVEGMRLIRQRRSDAIFLQSDACESFTATDAGRRGVGTIPHGARIPRVRSDVRSPGECGDASVAAPSRDAGGATGMVRAVRLRRGVHRRP